MAGQSPFGWSRHNISVTEYAQSWRLRHGRHTAAAITPLSLVTSAGVGQIVGYHCYVTISRSLSSQYVIIEYSPGRPSGHVKAAISHWYTEFRRHLVAMVNSVGGWLMATAAGIRYRLPPVVRFSH